MRKQRRKKINLSGWSRGFSAVGKGAATINRFRDLSEGI
jgi:hypothetical protein